MEKTKSPSILGQCIAEFLGTALIIFFGVGCVAASKIAGANLSLWEISIIWGFGVALAIYLTAGVSGAHLNPAVTITLSVFSKFNKSKIIPFVTAQILGAFCAAALIYGIYTGLFSDYETTHNLLRGTTESLEIASVFSTYPNQHISLLSAFLTEIVITAVLVSLIFSLTDDGNGLPRGALAPLLIGILIAVIGGATGPLTGFAMNPARDFGPKLFTVFAGWGKVALTGDKTIPYFIIPILGPIVGALVGGFAYKNLIAKHLVLQK